MTTATTPSGIDMNDAFAFMLAEAAGSVTDADREFKADWEAANVADAEVIERAETVARASIIECPKCGGSGVLHHYHYVANGVCFKCDGSGRLN